MIPCPSFVPLKITNAGAILLLSAAGASAATFSVIPSADAFVTTGAGGALSAGNYGGAGALAVSAAGLPQGELQTVMQFNPAGALSSFNTTFGAGQWTIQSVTLQLTASAPNNGIFNASAAGVLGVSWLQNDAWLEGTGSPAAPAATGISFTGLQGLLSGADESLGSFSFNGAASGASTFTLGLTSGFSADLFAGGGVSLRLFAGDAAVSGVFSSRSFATAAARPALTIVAVPEPGAGALSAAAAAMLLTRTRRRSSRSANQ